MIANLYERNKLKYKQQSVSFQNEQLRRAATNWGLINNGKNDGRKQIGNDKSPSICEPVGSLLMNMRNYIERNKAHSQPEINQFRERVDELRRRKSNCQISYGTWSTNGDRPRE